VEYVYMILKRDLKSLLVPSGKKTLKSRLSMIVGTILYAAMSIGIGYGAFRLFDYIRTALGPPPQLAAAIEINILNAISLFMLVIVFMTGIQTTYKAIYESDDIGFLMALPVPVQAIFVSKFASSYVSLAAVALVFGLPAWLGYGIAARAGVGFYLLALAGLVLLLLVAHAVVTFLLLVAMRHLRGRKMKQLFIASTAIFGVLIVLLSQIASSQLSRVEDPSKILETIGRGQLERTWYLPSTWMVNAVLGLSPEYGLNSLPNAAALVVVALGLSALSVRVSGKWFLIGWAGRTEESGAGAKTKNSSTKRKAFAHKRLPSGTYWAVLGKDLKLLFRDPLVWYNLVIGVITIGFFIFNQKSQFSRATPGTQDIVLASGLITFMSVLMGSIAGAQTGGISISREGSSFWLLRGSPASARDLFAAKMTYALLPPAVLFGLSLTAVYLVGMVQGSLGMTVLLGLSMVVAVASVQMLLDVFFPDFTLKVEFGSSKSGRGTGKLLSTMLGSMVVVFLFFFMMILPTTPIPGRLFPGVTMEQVTKATQVAIVAIAALTGAAAAIFGVRRMRRILTDM